VRLTMSAIVSSRRAEKKSGIALARWIKDGSRWLRHSGKNIP
jgi:hypothetical protein